MNKFKFVSDEEIDKMTPEELKAYSRKLAKIDPPTPEDTARWGAMAQEMVDNLNRNVGESLKRGKKTETS